jgi:hypothetical protein
MSTVLNRRGSAFEEQLELRRGRQASPQEQQTDAFLTHDWGVDECGRDNHARVALVSAALQSAGVKTWFDTDRMCGDVKQTMSSGVENTRVVVAFITERYVVKASGTGTNGANDNCKYEFDSALLAKHIDADCIIPVIWSRDAARPPLGRAAWSRALSAPSCTSTCATMTRSITSHSPQASTSSSRR